MTGMENVLAAHGETYTSYMAGRSYVGCSCGWDSEASPNAYVQHVAEALQAAGFGNLHDAWAEGVQFAQNYDSIYPNDNPYPAPKVSET